MLKFLVAFCVLIVSHGPALTKPVHAFENWKSEIVEGAGGVPLVVHHWGDPDGTPVLLIHGMGFGASAFKYQTGPSLKGLRFIAPDLRGMGLSGKPWDKEAYGSSKIWADDIAAVKAAHGLTSPVIVAWSFGGYVTMDYLRHCTEDCADGVVFVGTLAGLVPNPTPEVRAKYDLPPLRGNMMADNYGAFFEGVDWIVDLMSIEPPSAGDRLEKHLTRVMMTPLVRRALAESGYSLDNQDIAQKVTMPALFIHGELDPSVPPSYVADAVAKLPNAKNVLFDGVGHSPFSEKREKFNAALRQFVADIPRP